MKLDRSGVEQLISKHEQDQKTIKYNMYKIGWYMRGSLSYNDLMKNISVDDKEIMNTIIKENIELSVQAKMPLL